MRRRPRTRIESQDASKLDDTVLGAVLLTGYLGGAVATNLRVGAPLFSNVLFPVYVGVLLWGGLYLRDSRLRTVFPVRS